MLIKKQNVGNGYGCFVPRQLRGGVTTSMIAKKDTSKSRSFVAQIALIAQTTLNRAICSAFPGVVSCSGATPKPQTKTAFPTFQAQSHCAVKRRRNRWPLRRRHILRKNCASSPAPPNGASKPRGHSSPLKPTCVRPRQQRPDLLATIDWPDGSQAKHHAVLVIGHLPTFGQTAALLPSGRET